MSISMFMRKYKFIYLFLVSIISFLMNGGKSVFIPLAHIGDVNSTIPNKSMQNGTTILFKENWLIKSDLERTIKVAGMIR